MTDEASISETFNKKCDTVRARFTQACLAPVIASLGQMVTDLRVGSHDVKMDMLLQNHPLCSTLLESMRERENRRTSYYTSYTGVDLSGVMQIGADHYLLMIYRTNVLADHSGENNSSEMRLAVLAGDPRRISPDAQSLFEAVNFKINTTCSMTPLQDFILDQLARRAVIAECDVSGGLSPKPLTKRPTAARASILS